jgi:hypothetical protein
MIIAILLIKICLITYFIVDFPLFGVISQLTTDMLEIKSNKRLPQFINFLVNFVFNKPFNCYRCGAFWVGLIMTQNIFIAIGASFIMKVYDQKFNSMDL